MSDYNKQPTPILLCIIDDIKAVTDGISTQIDWKKHGITVSGTALNGDDGWSLIQSSQPDIILTDIRMPKLDGIAMTKKIKEFFPLSKVIMITGYNDFEYAQQAVKLGAFDLILKPFSLKSIEEIVLKAKQSILVEREKMLKQQQMEHQIKESLPVLRQDFFQLLLHYRSNPSSTLERLNFLQVDLKPSQIIVMILEIDHFMEDSKSMSIRDMELTLFALQSLLEETLPQQLNGIVFRENTYRFIFVFNQDDSFSPISVAEKCRENVALYTKYTLSIGLGNVVEHIEDISISYEQAITALSYHFYSGGNGVFQYRDIIASSPALFTLSYGKEQELGLAIRSGNSERTLSILNDIFSNYSSQTPLLHPEYLASLCYELGHAIVRTVHERVSSEKMYDFELQLHELRSNSKSYSALQMQVKDIGMAACRLIASMFQKEAAKVIDQSLHYIRSNLHLDLTIAHCAKQANFSPSYYTNLFKQETGLTFNHFVTQERMEQAKLMLMEDKQVQDISDSLGYINRRYFSDLFKKHTGMTPTEFRQLYVQGHSHSIYKINQN